MSMCKITNRHKKSIKGKWGKRSFSDPPEGSIRLKVDCQKRQPPQCNGVPYHLDYHQHHHQTEDYIVLFDI